MLNESFKDKPLFVDRDVIGEYLDYNTSLFSGGFFGFGMPEAATQKAKGIFFLQENQNKIVTKFPGWRVPRHLLFSAGTVFDDHCFDFPVFARPCPTVPRHGFVDSVICRNGDELNAVSKLTFETEAEAELLVTKPVDSSYNIIINGGVITFASGNDGATSGKGCHYFYISDDPIGQITNLDKHKIIAPDEVPFYEFVLDKKEIDEPVRLVQVRSAPHTPRVKDFVPEAVKVETILKAEGDLLEWEHKLKSIDAKTTIIDHTSGSLSSHYAIHAIINRIPIFTSYLPELGSLIEPTVEDTEINDEDREKFFKAFTLGFSSTPEIFKSLKFGKTKDIHAKMRDILLLALATLHNFSGLALSKDYEILGAVLGMFCRVTFAVSAGEARHGHNLSNGKFNHFFQKLPYNQGRNPCYEFMMIGDTKFCVDNASVMLDIFTKLGWGASYGGKRWAACTRSAINLFNACMKKEITEVVELFNKVINEEHNGGKYLNKVIDIESFDRAAQNPGYFTLTHLHTIVDLLHTTWSIKPQDDLSFFKEIDIDSVKEPVAPGLKNLEFYLNSSDGGGVFTTLTFHKHGAWHKITLPEPVPDPTNFCCIQCMPSKHIPLYSQLYWWTLEDGTKVISKAKLSLLAEVAKEELQNKKLLEEEALKKKQEEAAVKLKAYKESLKSSANSSTNSFIANDGNTYLNLNTSMPKSKKMNIWGTSNYPSEKYTSQLDQDESNYFNEIEFMKKKWQEAMTKTGAYDLGPYVKAPSLTENPIPQASIQEALKTAIQESEDKLAMDKLKAMIGEAVKEAIEQSPNDESLKEPEFVVKYDPILMTYVKKFADPVKKEIK